MTAMTTPVNGPRFCDIVHWSNPVAKAVERLASFHGRTFTVVSYAKDTRTARVELQAEASRWKYVALAVQLTILSPLVLIAALAKWLIVRRCQFEMVKPADSVRPTGSDHEVERNSPIGSIVESDADDSDVQGEYAKKRTGSAVASSSAELESYASAFIDEAQRQAEAQRAVSPTPTRRELERSSGDVFGVRDLNSRFVQRIEAPGTEFAFDGDLLSSSVVATYVAQTPVVPTASGTQFVPLFSLKRNVTDPLASMGHDVVATWNAGTVFAAPSSVAADVELKGDVALPLSAADESAAASALPKAGQDQSSQVGVASGDSSPTAASSEPSTPAKASSDEAEGSPRPRVTSQDEAAPAADEPVVTPAKRRQRGGKKQQAQRLQAATRQVFQGQAGSPASAGKQWRVKQPAAQTAQQ